MALPVYDDGGPLPPEVAIDEPPIDDQELEQWVDRMATAGYGLDDDMPESVRAFANSDFDPERAEWAMGRLAAAQQKIAEADGQHMAYQERLDRWHERATRTPAAEAKFFEGVLCNMLRQLNAGDPSIKSVQLPSGTIRSSGPDKGNEYVAEFADAQRFIAWAKVSRPDLIRTKYDALITEVRKGITATAQGLVATTYEGDVVTDVPGVIVKRKEREFKAVVGG